VLWFKNKQRKTDYRLVIKSFEWSILDFGSIQVIGIKSICDGKDISIWDLSDIESVKKQVEMFVMYS